MFKINLDFSAAEPIRLPGKTGSLHKHRNQLRRWGLRLGGTTLLVGLLWRLNLDWGKVFIDLSRANLAPTLAAVALIFPIIGLKAWRWKVILAGYKITISLGEAISLYGLGLSAGSITPGQAGDVVKAFTLKNKGFSLSKSLISVLLDRLFDVLVLVFLAICGLLLLGSTFTGQLPIFICLLALAGGITLILVVPGRSFPWFSRLLPRIIAHKFRVAQSPVQPAEKEPLSALTNQELRLKSIAGSLMLTLITAGLAIVRTWLLALAVGANLTPAAALAVSSLATVASLAPVTVSGIGARDLALVSVMGHLGYDLEMAVSLSTLLLFLNLFNLFAGYTVWFMFKPLSKPVAEKER